MSQRLDQFAQCRSSNAADSDQQAITLQLLTIGSRYSKIAITLFDRGDAMVCEYVHTGRSRGVAQAIDDRRGAIGRGEDPPVGFGFEFHAPPLEPFDRVPGVETSQRTDQRALASRVLLRKIANVETGMGDVAATASRNP